jgi:hypothetical protein
VAQGRKGPDIAGYVYGLRGGWWASNVRLQIEALGRLRERDRL